MTIEWKKSVSAEPESESISDINNYVELRSINDKSPIDNFYRNQREILRLATVDFTNNNSVVAPILIVSLVSNVEYYFRSLMAKCIKLCPITKKNASSKTLSLSSIYFGSAFLERGVFENNSFSGSQTINKMLTNIIGIKKTDIDNNFSDILEEFQKICELRHSVAHSSNILASKNAVNLGLAPDTDDYIVKATYGNLQEITAVCSSLVQTTNIKLFEEFINRWALKWRSESLPIVCDFNTFKAIWNIFFSQLDFDSDAITEKTTAIKVRNAVNREFGLNN